MDLFKIIVTKVWVIVGLLIFSAYGSLAQAPVIASLDKNYAAVNDTLSIAGNNFSTVATNNKVFFGAVEGRVVTASNTRVKALVPAGATVSSISILNTETGLTGYSGELFYISFGAKSFDPTLLDGQYDFAAEKGLFDLCMCDFDGDKKTDVATSHNGSNFVNVYRNTSSGGNVTFATKQINVLASTLNINCRDMNGDGKPDLAISRSGTFTGAILVLVNTSTTGNISFGSPQILTSSSNQPRRIEIRDLDDDGKPEIIATNQSDYVLSIFPNTSTGATLSFGAEIPLTIPVQTSTGLKVEDLNGDDKPEIIFVPYLASNLYVFENTSTPGAISFTLLPQINFTGNLANIAIGDLDGDKRPEIVVAIFLAAKITIFPNLTPVNGAITFGTGKIINTADRPVGVALGDVSGNGNLDIIFTSLTTSIAQQLTMLNNISTPGDLSFDRFDLKVNGITRNIVIGDLNGDAKPDIAFTSEVASVLSVFLNRNCVAPVIEPSGPIVICAGDPLRLNTTNGLGVTYEWFRDKNPVGGNNSYLDVTLGGEYAVRATSEAGACIENSEIITVTVIGGGSVTGPGATNSGPLCLGDTVKLFTPDIVGAVYNWTGPNGFSSSDQNPTILNFDPSIAGTYYVSFTKAGCSSGISTTDVQESILPDLTITTSDPTTFCQGKSATLFVPITPGLTFQWLKDGVAIAGATNFGVAVTETGSYSVRITNGDGCSKEIPPIAINVTSPPTASFTAPVAACLNLPVAFTDASLYDGNLNFFYQWDFGDGTTSSDQNPTHSYNSLGTFTVSLTVHYDDVDCNDSFSKTIEVVPSPAVSIMADRDTIMCVNDIINLAVEDVHTAYLWNTGATTSSIEVTEGGIYSVDVTTTAGCIAQAQIEVETLPLPNITALASTDQVFAGDTVRLSASGGLNYTWTPSDGLSDPNIPDPIAVVYATTTYTVESEGFNGCTGTAEVTVQVGGGINVSPKPLFSPNNDGQNDRWVIQNMNRYPDCTVAIFNRQGNLLFEQKSYYGNEWDGTYKGQPVIEGAYYFVIRCDGSQQIAKSGSLTLIR